MSARQFATTLSLFFLMKLAIGQPCQTTTTQILPPIAVCEGNCAVFNGEVFCSDTTVSSFNFATCEWSVQQIIIVPNVTVEHGTVGKISCAYPCANFKGKSFCDPGTYSIWEGCVKNVFTIGTQKDSSSLGTVGSVTCDHPVFVFEGTEYPTAGNYLLEDGCAFRRFTVGHQKVKPAIENLQRTCDDGEHFHVSFSIFEAEPPFFINNTLLGGHFFQSEQMENGASYSYKIKSQPTGCETTISGDFDCNGLLGGPGVNTTTGGLRAKWLTQKDLHFLPINANPTDGEGLPPTVSFVEKNGAQTAIFAPNVLKINALGENDHFTIFMGEAVFSQIQRLEIIDRNGVAIFQKRDFLPNQPELGWDGSGAQPGVFMWRAALLMPGGGVENLVGTVTVLP